MQRQEWNEDPIVIGEKHGTVHISVGDEKETTLDYGLSLALGLRSQTRIAKGGSAVAVGCGSAAEGPIAIGLRDSQIQAIGEMLAACFGAEGIARSPSIAIAWNNKASALSGKIAIALGKEGRADGLTAIALGEGGTVVAREGGSIALAVFDQLPGKWESPHGCDPTWIDGDTFLEGLKCAKVGSEGIRADYVYGVDRHGQIQEIGPAGKLNPYLQ